VQLNILTRGNELIVKGLSLDTRLAREDRELKERRNTDG
jgi:hypothetical protein